MIGETKAEVSGGDGSARRVQDWHVEGSWFKSWCGQKLGGCFEFEPRILHVADPWFQPPLWTEAERCSSSV